MEIMNRNIWVVCTTIGDGSFLDSYAGALCREEMADEVAICIIPDRKSPATLFKKCAELKAGGLHILCPSLEEQDLFLKKLGKIGQLIPYDSDNRRNVGYLMALEKGCNVVISIDDDNFLRDADRFFCAHSVVNSSVSMEAVHSNNGWFNICELMDVDPPTTYPRGFPYRVRNKAAHVASRVEEGIVHINAGLWLGHPDIDGVSALYAPAHAKSFGGRSVLLGADTWSPINTQNTAIASEALPAYYFLRMGYPVGGMTIDRDGDIFSGYFAQACARHLGYRVRVGTPVSDHRRNTHNYLRDLTHELPCIWMLEDVTSWLTGVKLCGDNYAGTYLCLSEMLEEEVERFKGFIWSDGTRGYYHYVAYCMRSWLQAARSVVGC